MTDILWCLLSLSLSSPVFHHPKLTRVLVNLDAPQNPRHAQKIFDRYESRLGVWATLARTGSKQREWCPHFIRPTLTDTKFFLPRYKNKEVAYWEGLGFRVPKNPKPKKKEKNLTCVFRNFDWHSLYYVVYSLCVGLLTGL